MCPNAPDALIPTSVSVCHDPTAGLTSSGSYRRPIVPVHRMPPGQVQTVSGIKGVLSSRPERAPTRPPKNPRLNNVPQRGTRMCGCKRLACPTGLRVQRPWPSRAHRTATVPSIRPRAAAKPASRRTTGLSPSIHPLRVPRRFRPAKDPRRTAAGAFPADPPARSERTR